MPVRGLPARGNHVGFPDVADERRYDLGVDSHPVQVKAGLDSQTIQEHLEGHPDIPVLAPCEAAKHFQDVPKVVSLP